MGKSHQNLSWLDKIWKMKEDIKSYGANKDLINAICLLASRSATA